MVHLVFVGRNDKNAVRLQQSLCDPKALVHKAEPLAVAPRVVVVDVAIVIAPVTCAAVVGRIDVDAVDLPCTDILQELERMEVLSVDDCMRRTIGPRSPN